MAEKPTKEQALSEEGDPRLRQSRQVARDSEFEAGLACAREKATCPEPAVLDQRLPRRSSGELAEFLVGETDEVVVF